MLTYHFISTKDFDYAIGGFHSPSFIEYIKATEVDNVFFKQSDIINKMASSDAFVKKSLHQTIISESKKFKRLIVYLNVPTFMEETIEIYKDHAEFCGLYGVPTKNKAYSRDVKKILIDPQMRKGDRDAILAFALSRGDEIWSTHLPDLLNKKPINFFLSEHWLSMKRFGQTALWSKEAGLITFNRKNRHLYNEQVKEKDLDFVSIQSYNNYLRCLKESVMSVH